MIEPTQMTAQWLTPSAWAKLLMASPTSPHWAAQTAPQPSPLHIWGSQRWGHFVTLWRGRKKKRRKKSKASAKIWLHLIYSPRLFFIKYVWLLSLIKCRINFGKLTTDAVYVQFYQTDLFISCQLLERLHFGAVLNC